MTIRPHPTPSAIEFATHSRPGRRGGRACSRQGPESGARLRVSDTSSSSPRYRRRTAGNGARLTGCHARAVNVGYEVKSVRRASFVGASGARGEGECGWTLGEWVRLAPSLEEKTFEGECRWLETAKLPQDMFFRGILNEGHGVQRRCEQKGARPAGCLSLPDCRVASAAVRYISSRGGLSRVRPPSRIVSYPRSVPIPHTPHTHIPIPLAPPTRDDENDDEHDPRPPTKVLILILILTCFAMSVNTSKALLPLTPLTSLRVSRHQIPPAGLIPNTSIQQKPLIIYHAAFPAPTPSASQIEAHLNAVGVVKPMWRYPMYPDDHFHTTAHEFLVIHHGRARLNFGGEACSGAVVVELGAGDAILIPAGVSHRLVQDLEGGFEMVGSYMVDSEHWDMCYGHPGEEEHIANIKHLPWFTRDPLYGDGGPAVKS